MCCVLDTELNQYYKNTRIVEVVVDIGQMTAAAAAADCRITLFFSIEPTHLIDAKSETRHTREGRGKQYRVIISPLIPGNSDRD